LTEDEKQVGVILADIGGGTTDIAVFKEGSIWHTAILPVAGYQLTRDVAIGLGLPFDVAEEIKKRYSSVMPVYEAQSKTTSTISADGHDVSYQDLCDIVRTRVEEIMRLILLELPRSGYESMVPAGLVLTGGSAKLSGIEVLGRDVLRLPVRVGVPMGMSGITDVLRDPAHTTSVGLLLWAGKHEGRRIWKTQGPFRRFVSRIKEKRATLTSIDVGTTKICTMIAEVDEGGGIRVVGVGVTPCKGLHKGLVVNINEAREPIRESVRIAEQSSGYKVESAYIGVTGQLSV